MGVAVELGEHDSMLVLASLSENMGIGPVRHQIDAASHHRPILWIPCAA
jgi:hypothetical protein